jgi:cobalt/nickel transport system ATP-binding protein
MPALVELRDVHFAYEPGRPVLRGASLAIAAGDRLSLLGGNGAGKTTLLHVIVGLQRPQAGHVAAFGAPRRSEREFWEVRARVGLLFQDPDDQLFSPTVREDVAFGPLNLGLSPREAESLAATALDVVGAGHLAARAPYHLSGGEKRAVAIAGVIAMGPDVLLLDEPSAGLDPAARRRLIGLLRGFDHTRIVATHDLDLVLDVCRRVLVMDAGQIVADGSPESVFADTGLLARCHLEPPLRWQGRDGASS